MNKYLYQDKIFKLLFKSFYYRFKFKYKIKGDENQLFKSKNIIDKLMLKIAKEGFHSLTKKEKLLLDKARNTIVQSPRDRIMN